MQSKVSNPHSNTSIELNNVSFSYGGMPVLENITLSVSAGDFVGVIGPNGGGKTTLLKLILGLQEPNEGIVKIFGHSVATAKTHFEIGYVPQHIVQGDFSFPATVREVVLSGRTRRCGIGRFFGNEDYMAAEEMMRMVGIFELADRPLDALSGGQRQRVFIARALAGEPKLLILDEPTVGVDSAAEDTLDQLLANLNRDKGMTIIMVSHDIDAVITQARHVVCVSKKIVCHVPAHSFHKEEYLKDVYDHSHEKTVQL
jgi:zinc transport system ATP-binding protein